jgi:hypothetical protein
MANTFGTFLDTLHQLEQAPRTQSSGWPEKDVYRIARMLMPMQPHGLPIRAAMAESALPQADFFGAIVAGRDKGIFLVDETGPEPMLTLTPLGRTLVA